MPKSTGPPRCPSKLLLLCMSSQDNALALLTMATASPAVQHASASFLENLALALKRSLAMAADPELSASAYGGSIRGSSGSSNSSGSASSNNSANSSDGSGCGSSSSSGRCCQLPLAAPAAGVLGASRGDPTCALSYPPLPLPVAGEIGEAWRLLPSSAPPVLDVTAAVHVMLLQVGRDIFVVQTMLQKHCAACAVCHGYCACDAASVGVGTQLLCHLCRLQNVLPA